MDPHAQVTQLRWNCTSSSIVTLLVIFSSLIVRLTVGVKEGQSKPSKSRDQPEDFYFEIKQFPCAISVADTTYDVRIIG